jgi:Plasmid pRiA4b ORF-3-like protein
LLWLDVAPTTGAGVAGARARPPEDVGGVCGYERFLGIMADPDDEEHVATKRWCGGHFDPEWFDLARTTRMSGTPSGQACVRVVLTQPGVGRPGAEA